MNKPLAGVRVLEWAIHHNGPAAGYMLGDLGAEVIKIEEAGRGDPCRLPVFSQFRLPGERYLDFEVANRSKMSITLDLKKERGKQLLYRLVEKSDVFFTNFHKRVAVSLGVDYATLRSYNPRLIYAHNTALGTQGPEKEKRTFDDIVQARSGFMYLVGERDFPEPLVTPGTLFDQMGATMLAYGILAALVARERTGQGQEVEVSLFGSATHLQQVNINRTLWLGRPYARYSRTRSRNPMGNLYQCADGQWLYIGESEPNRFWAEFCRTLGVPEVVEDPRFSTADSRAQHYRELIPFFTRIFASKNRGEWLQLFEEKGCRFTYSPVNTPADLAQDPQALENGYIVEFDHPTLGRVKTTGVPLKFNGSSPEIASPAPRMGEHTEKVLQEVAGYSPEEVSQLKEEGVI